MMDSRKIIISPIVSEKSYDLREIANQYVFKVHPRATKGQIAKAVEEIFEVTVLKVRTIRMTGKMKRMGRSIGRRSSWKKAFITLADGDTVDFFEGV